MPILDLAALSLEQRLQLIGEICDSLEGEALPMSDALQAELDRREASFDDDRAAAISWEEMREKLRPRRI